MRRIGCCTRLTRESAERAVTIMAPKTFVVFLKMAQVSSSIWSLPNELGPLGRSRTGGHDYSRTSRGASVEYLR